MWGDAMVTDGAMTPTMLVPFLSHAVASKDFHLVYQPKVWVRSGRHCGAEALIRWRHPSLGAIGPDVFIPLAERCGLIDAIGEWTVREACRFLASAAAREAPAFRMAVNLSPVQLRDAGLAEKILGILAEYAVLPEQIELEVTETALVESPEQARETLGHLRQTGVTVAIDDFGKGISSLAHLKRMPVDVIKLDQEFVAEIDQSAVDRRIVRTVVALGHTLGLKVVAEGVERQSQAELLLRCGIDVAQGFYYARPMDGTKLVGWLNELSAAPLVSQTR